MDWNTLKGHLWDIAKGAIGAAATAAAIALVQYLGAHLPDLATYLLTLVGGITGVKTTK